MSIRIRFHIDRGGFALDVDLALPAQGVSALFGHSGSGKTTLLRAIAGLERAPGGYMALGGEVWQDEARGIYMPTWQRAVGYVFQEASLFPHLSVRGNLEVGQKRARRKEGQPSLDAVAELLGIAPLLAVSYTYSASSRSRTFLQFAFARSRASTASRAAALVPLRRGRP